MAVRRALRTFDDLAQFLEEAEATLLRGGWLQPCCADPPPVGIARTSG